MAKQVLYEVVQGRSGWQLRRRGERPLVEFPTESQALRAAVAVCQAEGLARLVIRRASGSVEEVDPAVLSLETIEV